MSCRIFKGHEHLIHEGFRQLGNDLIQTLLNPFLTHVHQSVSSDRVESGG